MLQPGVQTPEMSESKISQNLVKGKALTGREGFNSILNPKPFGNDIDRRFKVLL